MWDRMCAHCLAATTVRSLTPASHLSKSEESWLPFLRAISCGLATRLLGAHQLVSMAIPLVMAHANLAMLSYRPPTVQTARFAMP